MYLFIMLALVNFTYAIDWQGHRGARGLYPENTINGMKEALKYPITTLEMDVVLSKDGEVVVSHEPWMSSEICLDPNGREVEEKKVNLYQLTYDQIVTYDCGTKIHPRFPYQRRIKEHKPRLRDVISEVEKLTTNKTINYSIEIKSTPEDEKAGYQPDIKTFTDKVMSVVGAIPHARIMIQSFDWRVLKYLQEKYPTIQLVALRESPYKAEDVIKELGFTPHVFSPYFQMLSKADVDYFRSKGVKVIPWTVNSVEEMKSLLKLGVDGIITDYPNLIAEASGRCGKNHSLFENKCVKVPKHAFASAHNPGWNCVPGYQQKRNSCHKIRIPKNAVFLEDGKTWACQEGFVRYRSTCRKK